MQEFNAQKRIQKLRSEIARLRDLYHVKDSPNVTDDVYDSLNKELKILLEKYPEFKDENSPENRIGGKPLDKFEKVKHKIKMFSIGNVFSNEELFAWEKRNFKLQTSLLTLFTFLRIFLSLVLSRKYSICLKINYIYSAVYCCLKLTASKVNRFIR